MDIISGICDVIRKNTVMGDRVYEFNIHHNLLESGMDSLQMIRVIVELERMLDIEFNDEDLLMANFSTISSIAEFIGTILVDRGINV